MRAGIKNWAGNVRYGTTLVHRPASTAAVRNLVRTQGPLKALGTRHSFNWIADCGGALVSTEHLNRVVAFDRRKRTVTVEAGVTYGRLCPWLHRRGFALHNLASLPHISVVGACATGTHGSGVTLGNLATAVRAMELVTADGEVRRLARGKDGEEFLGSVVHLGAIGVVTRLTMDVQPAYRMRQDVYEHLSLDRLAANFRRVLACGDSVSLFTDWRRRRIAQVWTKRRVGERRPAASPEPYGAVLARKKLHPVPGASAVHCTEQLGVPGPWHERLPHFKFGFTPSSGKELQSEYFVPLRDGMRAILAVERLRDRISPLLHISEIRTVAADRLWMSPAYGRSSLAIHFTWKPDWKSVCRVLPLIERALAPYGARPHWGKLFTMEPAVLRSRYEKYEVFRRLVQARDPRGKFRNEFLDRVLLG